MSSKDEAQRPLTLPPPQGVAAQGRRRRPSGLTRAACQPLGRTCSPEPEESSAPLRGPAPHQDRQDLPQLHFTCWRLDTPPRFTDHHEHLRTTRNTPVSDQRGRCLPRPLGLHVLNDQMCVDTTRPGGPPTSDQDTSVEEEGHWVKARPSVHTWRGAPQPRRRRGGGATPGGAAESSGLDNPGPCLLRSQERPRAPRKLTSSLGILLGRKAPGRPQPHPGRLGRRPGRDAGLPRQVRGRETEAGLMSPEEAPRTRPAQSQSLQARLGVSTAEAERLEGTSVWPAATHLG